jgi:FkbM family methyltransferase
MIDEQEPPAPALLSEEEVRLAFRFAFGREPRPVDIDWHRRHPSFDVLRQTFLATPEFRAVNGFDPGLGKRRIAVELANGASIWVLLDDLYVSRGIIDGSWEPEETAFIAANLKPGSVFLDIGSFLGWFTLNAAPLVGPAGAILAFEPQPEAHELLRRSVLHNRFEGWVSTFQLALSDEAGEVALLRDGSAAGAHANNQGHTWVGGAEPTPGSMAIGKARSLRLDDMALDRRIDLVKLDVEGAEWRVLKGAEQTIRTSRPVIVCEMFPAQLETVSGVGGAELIALLCEWGYAPFRLDPAGRLEPWQSQHMPSGEHGYTTIIFR